jgi:LmbE family N-acetylglucosaminyl deacetylase
LRHAAAALGLTEVALLQHPDGMLPWLEPGVLERDIRAAVLASRPEVVVTFGEDGLYWHPDHVAVHDATRAAVGALGPDAPALYYVTMPPGQMQAVLAAAGPRLTPSSRRDILGIDDAAAFGAAAQPPTLVLHTGPFAARKLAALQCHRTQVAGGPFDQLSAADAEALLGVEHYRRADVGSTAPAFIERLAMPSLESS